MKLKTWAIWTGRAVLAAVIIAVVAIYFSIIFNEPSTPSSQKKSNVNSSVSSSTSSQEKNTTELKDDSATTSATTSPNTAATHSTSEAKPEQPESQTATTHSTNSVAIQTQDSELTPLPDTAPKIRVYFEREMLPQAWVEAWQKANNARLEQFVLPRDIETLPTDGNLYSISPYYYGALSTRLKWGKLRHATDGNLTAPQKSSHSDIPNTSVSEDSQSNSVPSNTSASSSQHDLTTGMDPCFRAHSFDPDNISTLPWRWTPYLLMLSQPTTSSGATDSPTLAPKPKLTWPIMWWKESKAYWPGLGPLSFDFLVAMRLKEQPMSIHSPVQKAIWQEITQELERNIPISSFKSEKELWTDLQDGKISFTFLPAAVRIWKILNAPQELEASSHKIYWLMPPKGTLIQLELLAIHQNRKDVSNMSEEEKKKYELALSLLQFLLHPDRQKEMMQKTGYFPVHGEVHQIIKSSPAPLPSSNWLDRSEYLLFEPKESTPSSPSSSSSESQPTSTEPTGSIESNTSPSISTPTSDTEHSSNSTETSSQPQPANPSRDQEENNATEGDVLDQ